MKVSEEILKMIPYKPGKPISETQREFGVTEVYKLASNENPLGLSPKVKSALEKGISGAFRYPDASCYELVQKLSATWQVSRDNLVVGNGSDELIDLLVRIYCEAGDSILTSELAFVAYSVRAAASRVKTRRVPLKSTPQPFTTDLKAMAQYLREKRESEKIRLVFIPNPNNPTGTYVNKEEMLEFLNEFGQSDDLLIVFDEAYNEFVRAKDYASAAQFFGKYKSVLLLRTMSKAYGLAGLRVGVLYAPAETVDLMNRVRTPFNVNEFAQIAAIAALEDTEFIRQSCEATWSGLDYFYAELKKLALPYIESQGNFVLFDTKRDAKVVDLALLKRGVIMRPVGNYGLHRHMRLSVGQSHENQFAMKALAEVIKEIPES